MSQAWTNKQTNKKLNCKTAKAGTGPRIPVHGRGTDFLRSAEAVKLLPGTAYVQLSEEVQNH